MFQKLKTATIADIESALATYKKAVAANPKREGLDAKKLAVVVDGLMPKSDVSKRLAHAYTIGEGVWAKKAMKKLDGFNAANEKEKIMEHITSSAAYRTFVSNPETKVEAEAWIEKTFFSESGDRTA